MSNSNKFQPSHQHGCWTSLIQEALRWGCQNMDPEVWEQQLEAITPDLFGSFSRRSPDNQVRPSTGINCSAHALLRAEGAPLEQDEGNSLLFATGHLHHAVVYAALWTALVPLGFRLTLEKAVALPDWWPKESWAKQEGHIDLILEANENQSQLEPGVPRRIVCDIKSKHALGMNKVRDREALRLDNEVWGNLEQLAVYADQEGLMDAGALIIYSNRECPKDKAKQYTCRRILPEHLVEARDAVKRRLAAASAGEFDPELWLRKQATKGLFVPCQGYCAVQGACEARRNQACSQQ